MEVQASGLERFRIWVPIVSSSVAILSYALSFFEKLPPPVQEVVREHPYVWGGCLFALLVAGCCFWFLLRPQSRLLMPDRFVIRADEPRHLMGRQSEVRELTDLCERQPLAFLEGESGSGKSALARAGLVAECRGRHRLYPLYLDLSGADWEERLPSLLAGELWRSLAESDRQGLGLQTPCAPEEIFPLLAAFVARLGRTPLLIFDQFDDYQSTHHRHFHEGRERITWIKADRLLLQNRFWREIARLVETGGVHCLFITRTDNAAGLDAVRFVEARTFRLSRVSRSLMAPLLEEVAVEAEGRPVVAYPERGWEQLKRRLLRDLSEEDVILPIRLSVALQALRRFRVLTVREYQRFGGAEGLEQLHIERNLAEAAQAAGFPVDELRKALMSLVDPVRSKTLQLSTSELGSRIAAGGAGPEEHGWQRLRKALEHLEVRDVVRRRAGGGPGEDVWLLYHDFLCRGVMAAEHHANRWHALLHERARQFGLSMGITRRWRALLSPWQQMRLGLTRLGGRFHYAEHRRFALLSTVRFLPYLIVLLAGFEAYRVIQDDHLARRIFATLRHAPTEDAKLESANIRLLASSSERVQWRVLELAFASEKNAAQARDCLPALLHVYLRLDPTGERRRHFWKGILKPALEKRNGSAMVELAVSAFVEAPGVDDNETRHDARFVTQKLLDVIKGEQDGRFYWGLPDKFQHLARESDSKAAREFSEDILKEMESKESLRSRVSLATGLKPFAPHLSEEQTSRVVAALVRAKDRKGDYDVDQYEFGQVLRPFVPHLSFRHAGVLSKELVALMASPSEDDLLAFRHEALVMLVERLDGGQLRTLADRLVELSLQESDPLRLAWLMRGLGPAVEYAPAEARQQALRKVVEAMEREPDASGSELFFEALKANRKVLDPEQARRTAQIIFRRMGQERDFRTVAILLGQTSVFGDLLDAETARRVWDRILKLLEEGSTSDRSILSDSRFTGVAELARLLSQAQRAALLESLIDFYGGVRGPVQMFEIEIALIIYFKKIAPLLDKEQAQVIAGRLVRLIEEEPSSERVRSMCYMAWALGAAEDADLARRAGERLLRLMEDEHGAQELRLLAEALVKSKADLPDLGRRAADLLLRSLSSQKESIMRSSYQLDMDNFAMALESYVDYLDAAEAQKALETIVDIVQAADRRVLYRRWWEPLEPLWQKVPQETVTGLAKRVACRVQQAAAEASVFIYTGGRRDPYKPVAAFLQHAPEEVLVDILKQPFALDPLRSVVLRALELKYRTKFNGNLGLFVRWASNNLQTRKLVAPPPFPGFLWGETRPAPAADCTKAR